MLLTNGSGIYLFNILVHGTITITGEGYNVTAKLLDEKNKGVIFKNFTPSTDSVSKINNTQINNAKDLDVAITMYDLIEYSNNFS